MTIVEPTTRRALLRCAMLLLLTALGVGSVSADSGVLYQPDRLSSGRITCLCQDREGFVWVGTEYGLSKFDGYHFTHYLHLRGDTTSLPDNEVATLYVDDEGTLWVGCSRGLAHYDAETDGFVSHRFPDDRRPRVNSLLCDHEGRLLIGTAGYGLYSIRKGTGYVHYEKAMNSRSIDRFYSRMFLDREQALWRSSHVDTISRFTLRDGQPVACQDFVSPHGQPMSFLDYSADAVLVVCQHGLLRYDYRSRQLTDAGFRLGPGVSIETAMLDAVGNIYIGTTEHGLMVIRRGEQTMEPVENDNGQLDLRQTFVADVMEDRHQNLWVGCYNKGLLLLGKGHEAFSHWSFASQNHRTGGSTAAIIADGGQGVFCSVQPGGVYHFDAQGHVATLPATPSNARTIHRDAQGRYWMGTEGSLCRYQPLTGQTQTVATFGGRGLNCMADDGHGTLYVGVYGTGLCIFDTRTGQSELLTMNDQDRPGGYLCNNWIHSIFVDSRQMVWICTADGLSMMKPEGRVFNSQHWNYLLGGHQCYSACETSDGNLLVGTDDGLYLYDRDSNTIALHPGADALHDKLVCAMQRDQEGNVWISTTLGIWQLSPDGSTLIAHINGNGLQTKEYVVGASLHLMSEAEERIFFGTADGITTFRPVDVIADTTSLGPVFLTRLTVNGRAVARRAEHDYRLRYEDNTLTMEFSLLDYRNAENISFQYRLNGAKAWQSTSEGDNLLTFTELQPGTYQLEVRASSNGRLSARLLLLTFNIAQPWYRTVWAYLLYLVIIGSLVGLVLYNYVRQQRRDLEETKMRFLINATHDIRSPLTLIMGAVEKAKGQASGMGGEELDTIDRNAQRLLLLVNQILDERKIDKGQMRLHCQETEIVGFIEGIYSLYAYSAQQRGIAYTYHHPQQKQTVWIDREQFDKVVSNLLSNAFKYTPDGGTIDLSVAWTDSLVIEVMDSGLGFEDDHTERFFERFYQGKHSRDLHINGTGIGLNLSRAITEMHGGSIKARNRHDGVSGALLTVTLPLGKEHLKPDEIEEKEPQLPAAPKSQPSRNLRLLVVDDNPEIGRYISTELSQWYRFDLASNGREALKLVLTRDYDLVISDVMMPEMDGLTLLRSIKQNPKVSHLPVILLTSKSEVEYRLEGLKKGADAYLAKPFQMAELHVLIDNLVDNMRRLRGKFSGAQEQQERVEPVEVKGNNDALMERVMRCINAHLSDSDFSVDVLTDEVGISRAQLHRKMKEITGISTSEFIRNLRLEQAARLIREKKINITQVAYSVGFNNQTHFSTVFKKHFGMTPTEFAAQADEG